MCVCKSRWPRLPDLAVDVCVGCVCVEEGGCLQVIYWEGPNGITANALGVWLGH